MNDKKNKDKSFQKKKEVLTSCNLGSKVNDNTAPRNILNKATWELQTIPRSYSGPLVNHIVNQVLTSCIDTNFTLT